MLLATGQTALEVVVGGRAVGRVPSGRHPPLKALLCGCCLMSQVQKQSNPLLTAISWLLLLAALLLAVAVGGRTVLAWSSRDRVLYAVVIDSGSSGTRM